MSAWRMSRSFLGTSPSVREARRFITTFLAGWPIVESAELIVSELAANAVRHTASGRFGGQFQVMIHAQHDRVWLGVVDAGAAHGPSVFSPEDDEEGGRGLMIVGALADTYGIRGDERGRTVWALLLVNAGKNAPAAPLPGSEASRA
ncbi:ATP-binding protein [Sphaerisporangium dianthi]|uniref:ATP-binding protein n=1 Tax=Sphaerisporangium dianthi TaxID=1436120 RepID=A0ABV9CMK4_9ACTN